MARPYRDAVELVTEKIPDEVRSVLMPPDARWIIGMSAPSVPDPVKCILLPGYEYRIRQLPPANHDGDIVWIMERRGVGVPETPS